MSCQVADYRLVDTDSSSPDKQAAMIYPAVRPSATSELDMGSDKSETLIERNGRSDPELQMLAADDFEVIRVLGVGTYGVVKLAKHKPSGTSVALKVLSKEHVVTTRQEKHILRERAVHLQLEHPLVAKLHGTFQDDDYLYLVLEYLPGGELWSLVYSHSDEQDEEVKTTTQLKVQGSMKDASDELRPATPVRAATSTMSESLAPIQTRTLDAGGLSVLRSEFGGLKEEYAVFYLGCILSALEYLHDQGLLYRDLKLENLVLDKEGYLKILDFGFAKPDAQRADDTDDSSEQTQNARNLTLCGSMDYMAPEVLLRQSHDHRVDIWSFGVIMYEILLGKTPFYHENPRELGRRITNENVEFPNEFEEECPLACDLITQLLVKNPDERLSSMQKIKSHWFFSRMFSCPEDWQRLQRREYDAPFIPELSGPFDTSFFQTIDDDYQEELEADVEPYFEDGSNIFRDF
ncbi:cyclic AMP-dependent protein kinase-like protein catalytic subunit [Phytophthora sojae]|uniref:Cyclic AMP-dependent protein kinase-like protein catalytic subunit n=1 Tax=Phytophthora sojae (strain P6497) TaxID=1094619 RepID=G4ZSD6_PHYSP|nr:cyclic AMP-dependent protein kinase-like protein catalytic subunit [Phytophthora sojae]EGZ14016.1 cyclic AMP-dependent protein kinase-like protein catalytic subunit [Phytophthora sojae]|eukprot:XP_009531445.1 cyclic AMP-dependent protein kinase-like protein catalytic subunit [Phytophthora sojae]